MTGVFEDRQKQKRILIAALVAAALHVFFIFFIAPRLKLSSNLHPRTEVVQISAGDLERLKKRILENSQKPALLQQEARERFKSETPPKDARFLGPHHQIVPEETVAGAQREAPQIGRVGPKDASEARGERKKSEAERTPKKLTLSRLGLGSKPLPKPRAALEEDASAENAEEARKLKGPSGDDGRPVGREDPRLKKGDDNFLNAIESEYYSFFSRFEEPIIRNWYFLLRSYEGQIRREVHAQLKSSEGEFPVTIEFVIDRAGNFVRIAAVESSRIPTLDQATLQAVRKLGSLPNPPPGLFKDGPTFSYKLQFLVRISGAPMAESSPDLHWF